MRAPGIKNKRTIAREDARNRAIAGLPKREEAYDVLYRMLAIAEGAAAECRPLSNQKLAEGAKAPPNADWDRFHQWIDLAVYCAKELASYQRPKLKAIMPLAPPITEPPKVVEYDPAMDNEDQRFARVSGDYLRLIKGGKAA